MTEKRRDDYLSDSFELSTSRSRGHTYRLPSQRASYAENVPFDDVILCSVIKQKWRTCLMGEVRSLGQGLQLVMPEWQPWVADHLASGMSTSLGPPFTLHYNEKKASHLDTDFIIRTPHPTIKGTAMGCLSWVPCIAKVMDANNLQSPLLQAMAWGRRHRWRIQLLLAPLEGVELVQATEINFIFIKVITMTS